MRFVQVENAVQCREVKRETGNCSSAWLPRLKAWYPIQSLNSHGGGKWYLR